MILYTLNGYIDYYSLLIIQFDLVQPEINIIIIFIMIMIMIKINGNIML